MFDVGFWELAMIGAIALVIIGPERLPAAARTAGLWVNKARGMLREVKADISRELREHEIADLDELKDDLQNVGDELKSTSTRMRESIGATEITESLKTTFEDASPLDKKRAKSTRAKKVTKKKSKKVSKKASKKAAKKRAKKVTKKKVTKKTAKKKSRASKK